jgi:hypothetical protein
MSLIYNNDEINAVQRFYQSLESAIEVSGEMSYDAAVAGYLIGKYGGGDVTELLKAAKTFQTLGEGATLEYSVAQSAADSFGQPITGALMTLHRSKTKALTEKASTQSNPLLITIPNNAFDFSSNSKDTQNKSLATSTTLSGSLKTKTKSKTYGVAEKTSSTSENTGPVDTTKKINKKTKKIMSKAEETIIWGRRSLDAVIRRLHHDKLLAEYHVEERDDDDPLAKAMHSRRVALERTVQAAEQAFRLLEEDIKKGNGERPSTAETLERSLQKMLDDMSVQTKALSQLEEKKAKRGADTSKASLCSECEYLVATRHCDQCAELYCFSCYQNSHRKGTKASHTYMSVNRSRKNDVYLNSLATAKRLAESIGESGKDGADDEDEPEEIEYSKALSNIPTINQGVEAANQVFNSSSGNPVLSPSTSFSSRSNMPLVNQELNHLIGEDSGNLFTKVKIGETEEVKQLLKKGANPSSVDASGDTLLMVAAASNAFGVAEALIQAGADVNAQNFECNTALHYAYTWYCDEIIQLLKDNGASEKTTNIYGMKPREGLRPTN